MTESEAQETVRAMGVRLVELGLTAGTWGNASVRFSDEEMAITPSGFDYLAMKAGDVVIVNLRTGEFRGGKPSTEKALHIEIYKRRPAERFRPYWTIWPRSWGRPCGWRIIRYRARGRWPAPYCAPFRGAWPP